MDNFVDYLSWRGDLPMRKYPFNEVDSLIFAELAYADMAGIVPDLESGKTVSLQKLASAYEASGRDQSYLVNDPKPLLLAAGKSPRFRDVRVGAYEVATDVEQQYQFAAVCFYLKDGSCYVAYRGTDNSIVGWREDFNFSFLEETCGQQQAQLYLERVAWTNDKPLRVGGHSKGGNLAVFAAAFCKSEVKERILQVDSFDGPGFNRSVVESPEYQEILDKVQLTIPESAVVGQLLINKEERQIVKSTAEGILQHDPYSWGVLGTHFVTTDHLSATGAIMDTVLHRWLEDLDDDQRANLVSAIFDSLDASGALTLSELNKNRWQGYGAVLKALVDMDPERQKSVKETLLKLGAASRDAIWEEARHSVVNFFKETLLGGREEKKDD